MCPSNTFAGLPDTPSLEGAYEQGLLDGNLGQMASFQSTYKSTLRIEVPVWPEIRHAALPPAQAQRLLEPLGGIPATPPKRDHSGNVAPASQTQAQDHTTAEPADATDADEGAEEEEDDKYVAPEGQGCFSFRQSLLHRAKDTYAARCTGNKYEIISKWPNWQFLAKRGTLTATPQHLLRRYYRRGYPAGLVDKKAMPYVLPWHNAISEAEWQRRVRWFCHSRYLHDMDALYAERAELKFDTFYRTMDLTNPIKAMQYDQTNSEQAKQAEQAEQATQDEQAEQTTVPTQQTMTGPGPHPADRFTTARTRSQCMDRQATVAATGSNQ